jgi:hypothetical protein
LIRNVAHETTRRCRSITATARATVDAVCVNVVAFRVARRRERAVVSRGRGRRGSVHGLMTRLLRVTVVGVVEQSFDLSRGQIAILLIKLTAVAFQKQFLLLRSTIGVFAMNRGRTYLHGILFVKI